MLELGGKKLSLMCHRDDEFFVDDLMTLGKNDIKIQGKAAYFSKFTNLKL